MSCSLELIKELGINQCWKYFLLEVEIIVSMIIVNTLARSADCYLRELLRNYLDTMFTPMLYEREMTIVNSTVGHEVSLCVVMSLP